MLRLTDTALQNNLGVSIFQECRASTWKDNEHICSSALADDPTSEGWVTNPKKANTLDWIEIIFNQ